MRERANNKQTTLPRVARQRFAPEAWRDGVVVPSREQGKQKKKSDGGAVQAPHNLPDDADPGSHVVEPLAQVASKNKTHPQRRGKHSQSGKRTGEFGKQRLADARAVLAYSRELGRGGGSNMPRSIKRKRKCSRVIPLRASSCSKALLVSSASLRSSATRAAILIC
jgi:hypothetical protein